MSILFKCPYCLHSFTKEQAQPVEGKGEIRKYRCPNERTLELDQLLCGKILPVNFFEHGSHVISISGATGVGKTFYLSALLRHVLFNRELHKFGISGNLIGEEKAVQGLRAKLSVHREQGGAIGPSQRGVEHAGFVLHVTIARKGRTHSLYLSLFDNPGERFQDADYMHENMVNVFKADALLFLIDPLQIAPLSDIVLERYISTPERTNPIDLYDVLYNVTEVLKYAQRNGLTREAESRDPGFVERVQKMFLTPSSGGDRIRIPVAFGISKADLFDHTLLDRVPFDHADFSLRYTRGHQLDGTLVEQLSAELHDLVFDHDKGDVRLFRLLQTNYSNYKLFTMKSINGQAKEADRSIPEVDTTQGVLLPFLWLLSKLNLL
jgi:hypothetical protein